uniref:Uncharacterized protein n=1 Tax=Sphaerodactylus townsendi TaxID=933632 RepID=A0ACB8E4M0_9SAUR
MTTARLHLRGAAVRRHPSALPGRMRRKGAGPLSRVGASRRFLWRKKENIGPTCGSSQSTCAEDMSPTPPVQQGALQLHLAPRPA